MKLTKNSKILNHNFYYFKIIAMKKMKNFKMVNLLINRNYLIAKEDLLEKDKEVEKL